MIVRIPSPLRSYTGQRDSVQASGATLDALLWDLDRQFPGIRFRIIDEQNQMRPHMIYFVNGARTHDLERSLMETDEVMLVHALSGG